ncbi:unnamed protein product, partial [Soboliphyme baturini]|uniref:ABC transmembrane type-1 domain-containing protein n=1 Tax=Soboliphyme baturini TaxID=241478 RepID=A0A183J487_9BILA
MASERDDEWTPLLQSKETKSRCRLFRGRRAKSDEGTGGRSATKSAVGITEIFRYAERSDVLLMAAGTLFAVIHGAGWPMLSMIIGGMTNTFIRAENSNFSSASSSVVDSTSGINTNYSATNFTISPDQFISDVTKFAVYYVAVGVVIFVTTFLQVSCWSYTCERQMFRIRREFFRSVLHLDVSWYDRHPSGELTSKLNDDIERIREGIGDKFSLLIQFVAAFLSGFVIGFVYNWRLTLVMLSLTPFLAGS